MIVRKRNMKEIPMNVDLIQSITLIFLGLALVLHQVTHLRDKAREQTKTEDFDSA